MWRETLDWGSVNDIAFSGDGASVVAVCDESVFAWHLATRRPRKLEAWTDELGRGIRLVPSPDGRCVMTVASGVIHARSLMNGATTDLGWGDAAAFVDGRFLLLLIRGGFDLERGSVPLLPVRGWPSLADADPLAGLGHARIKWLIPDTAGRIALVVADLGAEGVTRSGVVHSADGQLAVRWDADWNPHVGGWHGVSEAAGAFITGDPERCLAVRDLNEPGTKRFELQVRAGGSVCTAFHPGGRYLAVGTAGGNVRFFDARTGVLRQGFNWKIGRVKCVAFSPDGLLCAAGGDKQSFVVWDVDA